MAKIYKSVIDRQYFDGKTFTRYAGNAYYWWKVSSSKNGYTRGKSVSMHRYIWQFFNGEIPEGYQIHHIDHDRSNNNISNLELVLATDHIRYHAKKRWQNNAEGLVAFQRAGIQAAAEWHKSEAGKKWHKQHALNIARSLKTHGEELICTQCNKPFIGLASHTKRGFCSASCQGAARLASGVDDVEKTCVICNNIFLANKYRGRKTCSKLCASEAIRRSRLKHKE